jgi:hypothetical protein
VFSSPEVVILPCTTAGSKSLITLLIISYFFNGSNMPGKRALRRIH